MCLTEPHCGTDLGLLRTKAEPQADGTYRITGNKIFISRRRARHGGQHHPPGAGPPAGRAARAARASACSWCPSSTGERRRLAGRAQRHLLRRPGAQDGHPRQRHRADRARRRRRHAGGRAQQGPAGDVRDDERRAPGRGQPVAGPDRSGLPERAGLRQGPHPDALAVRPQGQGQAGRPDHRAPRRAQDAADRQGLCRRRPRAGDLLHAAARQGAAPPRREGAQGQPANWSRCSRPS